MDTQKNSSNRPATFVITPSQDGSGDYHVDVIGWDDMDSENKNQIMMLLTWPRPDLGPQQVH